MEKVKKLILMICLIVPPLFLYFWGKELLAFIYVLLFLLMFPVIKSLRKVRFKTNELVVLSLLGTLAALFRVPFAIIPSVQPTTFIIIITGIVAGRQAGFIVGLLAAFISNLYLGHGLWTLFQMVAWSLIGFYAGFLKDTFVMKTVIGRTIYGLVTGIIFGWFMNLSFIIFIVQSLDIKLILPYYIASFPFDLNHGLTNAFLLLLFGHVSIQLLNKLAMTYNLFNENHHKK